MQSRLFVTRISEIHWTLKTRIAYSLAIIAAEETWRQSCRWMCTFHWHLMAKCTVHEIVNKNISETAAYFFQGLLAILFYSRSEHDAFMLIICLLENASFLPTHINCLQYILQKCLDGCRAVGGFFFSLWNFWLLLTKSKLLNCGVWLLGALYELT